MLIVFHKIPTLLEAEAAFALTCFSKANFESRINPKSWYRLYINRVWFWLWNQNFDFQNHDFDLNHLHANDFDLKKLVILILETVQNHQKSVYGI